MRDHDLLKKDGTNQNLDDNRMTVEEAVATIMIAADRRVRKVIHFFFFQ